MTSFKALGDVLVSCVAHGGIVAAAFAFSNALMTVPQEKVYRVSLVQAAMPAKADVSDFSPVSIPEPPLSAQVPATEAPRAKPEEKPLASPEAKPVSVRKKEGPPKPPVEEASAHTAAAEMHADSPEASFAVAGPSLQVEGFAVYGEDAVDRPPSVAVQVTPEYPQRARRMGVEGRVEVSLVVDGEGKPQACAVRKADPAGYFEEAALAAARKTRFIPGMVRGRPVNTLAHISFVFVLR
ncbi:MAG: TonB family protein [Deltaproteobacteria bacterium]|jgi:protein TonB|nr:TonB family protein [Deltaproteobacteria bacterium]